METPRKRLTIDEAIAWREGWSEGDRSQIRRFVQELGIVGFVEVPSGAYLHGKDGDGRTRLYINPGYLEFLGGWAPDHAQRDQSGPPYLVLSTFRSRGASVTQDDQPRAVCARCFMELPATGRCDSCD